MVNPKKGDVSFKAGDETYTLRYSHLALVKLEQQLGKGLMDVIQEMGDVNKMRIATVVSILWAGLQKHHPKTTFEDAAAILDDVDGGITFMIEVIGDAFQKAFNAPGAGTKGTHPTPMTGNGTGTQPSLSSSPPVTSHDSSGG